MRGRLTLVRMTSIMVLEERVVMKESVYLETSIISYLTARDSRDVVQLAKQQLTREWWANESSRYELLVGQPVLDEIGQGDDENDGRRSAPGNSTLSRRDGQEIQLQRKGCW